MAELFKQDDATKKELSNTFWRGKPNGVALDFVLFWKKYPRKVSKGSARKAWWKALKNATVDEIMDGLDRWTKWLHKNPPESLEYVKHPATWLNGEAWDDELPQPRQQDGDELSPGINLW